ncbi:MAG: type II secretion system GspH family protein [Puniceicoccales bacterium]|jgi:hypothetical protein|nr:type II secretion system GspH family protein [Puniceicoccales bacterium]
MFILQSVKSKNKSFTLVEIVFTIVIVGILLAIFLPVMSSIKLSAQKIKDVSHFKKITEAWYECVINRGWTLGEGNGDGSFWVFESIEKMAGYNRSNASDIVLNDPYVWVSPGDKYATKILKEVVCQFDGSGKISLASPWGSNVNNDLFSGGICVSYCFIAYGPISNVPLDTTPLAFTRGLCTDGT